MRLHRLAPLFALCIIALVSMAVIAAESSKPAPKQGQEQKAKTDPKKAPKPLPKLMDLGSTTCTPCKMMMPVLEALKKDYKGKLTVVFIDVWKNEAAAKKYKVQRIPTQIWFDAKGKEIHRHVGYISKEDIVKEFNKRGVKLTK